MTQERPRDGRNEFETFKERGLNSRFVLLGQDVYTMLKSGPFFKGGGRGRGDSPPNIFKGGGGELELKLA